MLWRPILTKTGETTHLGATGFVATRGKLTFQIVCRPPNAMLAVLLPDERAEVIDRIWRDDVEACKLAAEHWSFSGWRDARLQKVGKDIKEHEAQIASLQRDHKWLRGLQPSPQPQETRCVCGDVLAWRETSNGYFCTNMQCEYAKREQPEISATKH